MANRLPQHDISRAKLHFSTLNNGTLDTHYDAKNAGGSTPTFAMYLSQVGLKSYSRWR